MYPLFDYALNITKVNANGIVVNVSSNFIDYYPIIVAIIPAVIAAIIAFLVAKYQSRQQKILANSQRELQKTLADSQSVLQKASAYSQTKLQETSNKYQGEQVKLASMLSVFKVLNNNRHRIARECVCCAYHLSSTQIHQRDIFQREPYHAFSAMVRADMDQMGILIEERLVDEALFLKAYWNTVLVMWKALEKNIEEERSLRQDYPGYMKHFQALNQKAMKYRDDNKLGSGEVLIYAKDECAAKFNPIKIDNLLQ